MSRILGLDYGEKRVGLAITDPLNIIAKPIEKELNIVMSNSFGFGGTNSNLIIKKYAT